MSMIPVDTSVEGLDVTHDKVEEVNYRDGFPRLEKMGFGEGGGPPPSTRVF